ncbi:MAG: AEC family transporter, partial [Aeromonas veronii]
MDLLASLLFSLSITGPICVILLLGIWLKRLGLLPEPFTESASRLVFQVTLPALLFLSILGTNFATLPSPWFIGYGLLATVASYLVLELLAGR